MFGARALILNMKAVTSTTTSVVFYLDTKPFNFEVKIDFVSDVCWNSRESCGLLQRITFSSPANYSTHVNSSEHLTRSQSKQAVMSVGTVNNI